MCGELGLRPEDVGLLPYAVAEGTERLAVAFAEYRRWPDNPVVQHKCLVYAGYIAHYAQDLCQPLHVTVHHDGWADPNGTSPRTGIHARVDGLIQRLGLDVGELAEGQKISPLGDLMGAIDNELRLSHSLVPRVYELEGALPPVEGFWEPAPEVVAFATKRAREAVRVTAALYLTAWVRSAKIELPAWFDRED